MDLTEFIAFVKRLLFEYSNEIPEQILHSSMLVEGENVDPLYKCRKGWFLSVVLVISAGREGEWLSSETCMLTSDFVFYLEKTSFSQRPRTWKYDIDRADEVLRSVLSDVEATN